MAAMVVFFPVLKDISVLNRPRWHPGHPPQIRNASLSNGIRIFGRKRYNVRVLSGSRLSCPSGLPDAAILIQEHNRYTNELGCNWFTEILRFPHGRDQMSFTYAARGTQLGMEPVELFPKCYFVVAAREYGHQHRSGLG
eukprot:560439-Prorocentrum_minimum.AAC.4